MALVYNFSFASPAAGETVTVTDDSGTEYASEELGTTIGDDGAITLQVALDEGEYTGTVSGSFGTWFTRGELDVPTSITSQPGASETAYLIATGPVYTTDGAGTEGTLVFEADNRQGSLPSWASINAGNIDLSEEAGTCGFAVGAVVDIDFSGASAVSDAPGVINSGGCDITLDGDVVLSLSGIPTDGDNQNIQTTTALRGGGVIVASNSTITGQLYPAASDDAAANIADAAATPRVAFTITRLAPSPVLPAAS